MRTIFKTYGMYSPDELEVEEEYAKEFLMENMLENDEVKDEPSDEEITQEIYDRIEMTYGDEKLNLNKRLNGRILAIANLGLWNGRRSGYKILGDNLNEILTGFGCDEWQVVDNGFNIVADGYHHDGHNYVEYREIKEDTNYEVLLNKLYSNEPVSRKDINRYTRSIRKYVKEIYG